MATSRRRFLKVVGGAGVAMSTAAPVATAASSVDAIPRRPLGKTGLEVSIMGLGGSHLAAPKDESEAIAIVHAAIDAGINFMDNAWEYHDGVSEQRAGKALKGKRDRIVLMTKVCTHGRDAGVAMKQLEDSLKRLGTDHLDVWQIHECVYYDDPARHYRTDGVIAALDKAKQQGKVRFVGFTGHKDPAIHLDMLTKGYAFDTCQMPLNCFDAGFVRSFEQTVLPEVNRRGMAALGMKSLCGTGLPALKGAVTVDEALRYAMSLPVATTIMGVDSMDVLRQNLAIARGFQPWTPAQMAALRRRAMPYAEDGELELYKTSKKFDAKVGRQQHGYPLAEVLPL
jgi:aryl-alcohol dehydrogenase-like predicted oxidoreductase